MQSGELEMPSKSAANPGCFLLSAHWALGWAPAPPMTQKDEMVELIHLKIAAHLAWDVGLKGVTVYTAPNFTLNSGIFIPVQSYENYDTLLGPVWCQHDPAWSYVFTSVNVASLAKLYFRKFVKHWLANRTYNSVKDIKGFIPWNWK